MPNKRKFAASSSTRGGKRFRSGPDTSCINDYKGWCPPQYSNTPASTVGAKLEQCKAAFLKPRRFWAAYIAQRRPVHIPSGAQSLELPKGWSFQQMEKAAGNAPVSVEKAGKGERAFGKGKKISMTFRKFLEALEAGEEGLYLSTQEAATDEKTGLPEVVSPPLSSLLEDGQERPSIMGNLVPQALNLWIGSSAQGTSSRLHHDYHDNLYVLLEGSKTFRLWSPAHAQSMHTYGDVVKVHPNGRIVYQGQGDVLADGSSQEDVSVARHSRCKQYLESESDSQEPGVLDDTGDSSDSSVWEGRDDFDDCVADDSGEEGEESEEDKEEPPSFSRVDLSASPSDISRNFPGFPGLAASLSCPLEAGDVLYLPAGWFHEVTSRNCGGDGRTAGQAHMALNYWFHPPDNPDATASGFSHPYLSPYWPAQWRTRYKAV